MAFNSSTYHANRYQREAADNLARARDIKARLATGDAYEWEAPRVATFAKLAIIAARLGRSHRAIAQLRKVR